MKKYWKMGVIVVGALLGYSYYHFIGCRSGVCPITSNPWISTAYGALIGFIFTLGRTNKRDEVQPDEND
ncbi:hypothetical protein JXB12_07070 [candidate division KSB1 bacterium]|nr:hypothetical protein [candidate division KSB1 bacterium]